MRYETATAFRMALEQRMKTEEPGRVRTSDFLSFAGIEPLELPAIPIAQHLAEKVHAYTRSYDTTDRPSIEILNKALLGSSELRHPSTLTWKGASGLT